MKIFSCLLFKNKKKNNLKTNNINDVNDTTNILNEKKNTPHIIKRPISKYKLESLENIDLGTHKIT